MLDSFEEGNLLFDGVDISLLTDKEKQNFVNENISFIFQDYFLLPNYSGLDNINIPLKMNGIKQIKKDDEILKKTKIENIYKRKVKNLSGGEMQKCAIARALSLNKRIIICDEPTGNLDKESKEQILDMLKEASKEKLVIVVSHDHGSILDKSDQIIELEEGRIKRNEIIGRLPEEKKETVKENKKYFNVSPKMLYKSLKHFSFVFALFLALIAFFVFISSNVFINKLELKKETGEYNTGYINCSKSRLIVEKTNKSLLDEEVVKYTNMANYYEYNNYYVDEEIYLGETGEDFSYEYHQIFSEKLNLSTYHEEIVCGREIQNDEEYLVGIQRGYSKKYASSILGLELTINEIPKTIKCVGVYYIDNNEKCNSIYVTGSTKEYFVKYVYEGDSNFFITTEDNYQIRILICERFLFWGTMEDNAIYLGAGFYGRDLYFNSNKLNDNYKIVYDDGYGSCDIIMNYKTFKSILEKKERLDMYFDSEEDKEECIKALKNDYRIISPSDGKEKVISEKSWEVLTRAVFSSIVIIGALSVTVLFIIKKLDNRRIREYCLYRMYGARKKDLIKVDFIQNVFVFLVAYLIIYLLSIFKIFDIRTLKTSLFASSVTSDLIIVLIGLTISFYSSYRFMRFIFSKPIISHLKGGIK